IILAGGNSHRFKSKIGKPYQKIAGKSLIQINVDKARKFNQIKKIVIVYNKKDMELVKSLKLKNVQLVVGGKTRQKSTYNALKYLIRKKNISKVLIHDAARPNFSSKLLNLIINKMKNSRAVIPKIKIQDAVKQIIDSSKEEYIIGKKRDNGIGITDSRKAVTPYFTTKKTGTGLGLPIVTKIINEHSGIFTIKNRKYETGTIVKILFPKLNA
ncbi:2-C-methyl-D-erythritol 4-phosphate cytidylyltransferase, partial [Pelagibacteraceae bacterium]|nr:2-C-methyl-D-erythritol 4-phosphate cytidylyltransferase [Pelagibacteraceae bacterium]